jgi:integrase
MSAVYGRALSRKLVKPQEDPRIGFRVKTARNPKKAIKREEMHILAKLDPIQQAFVEESRDMFLFSYYCQGMILKDISLLSWGKNIVDGRMYYARGNTLDLFNIKIKPETIGSLLEKQKIILAEKLVAGLIRNELAKKLVSRTFDDLKERQMKNLAHLTKVRKQRGKVINAHIRKLEKERLKYDLIQIKLLTFFAARHTYATVLMNYKASISLISEALGHADTRTTQVYLDSFAKSELDLANGFL